ncbi:hypothetical protein N431DRAFT_445616 [Stipitochalara longipes BDJ]|nr:hypothetical protein N431DRAFT_445616 [Stipitochalara longipes BDJ]
MDGAGLQDDKCKFRATRTAERDLSPSWSLSAFIDGWNKFRICYRIEKLRSEVEKKYQGQFDIGKSNGFLRLDFPPLEDLSKIERKLEFKYRAKHSPEAKACSAGAFIDRVWNYVMILGKETREIDVQTVSLAGLGVRSTRYLGKVETQNERPATCSSLLAFILSRMITYEYPSKQQNYPSGTLWLGDCGGIVRIPAQ